MNIEKTLENINEKFGIKIERTVHEDIILFHTPIDQPFKFNINILFKGITGDEKFIMNIPASNIEDVRLFTIEVNRVAYIISILNSIIEKLKN